MSGSASNGRAWIVARGAECVALCAVGPALYAAYVIRPAVLFPTLWGFGLLCLGLLLIDRSFDRRRLWNIGGMRGCWRRVLIRWAALVVVLGAAVWLADRFTVTDRELLFSLPRRRPWLWVAIMFGYPIASVYPQEVIFRAFFFHRYGPVLGEKWLMVAVNAAVFGWVHVVFHNWVAVALTVAGGVLFADTYRRSRSVAGVCAEHALYGCFVFTIGIGQYFYNGAMGR